MTLSTRQRPDHELSSIREKLGSEIAPVPWEDLQRSFARGIVLLVASELDLVDVAVAVADNNIDAVEDWMEDRRITAVSDDQARDWHASNASLLTAIVKPWVLVQVSAVESGNGGERAFDEGF